MDRRVKYTKRVIEETFLNLLEQKDITDITVTEICSIADINRATFYRYYIDIYDLLKQIQNEFISKIKNSDPMESLTKQSPYDFIVEILEILLDNQKLVKILFDTNNNIYFLNDIIEIAYDKCMAVLKNRDVSDDVDTALIFVFNGALGTINYWVKNDFDKSVEEVAKVIENISMNGIKKILY